MATEQLPAEIVAEHIGAIVRKFGGPTGEVCFDTAHDGAGGARVYCVRCKRNAAETMERDRITTTEREQLAAERAALLDFVGGEEAFAELREEYEATGLTLAERVDNIRRTEAEVGEAAVRKIRAERERAARRQGRRRP